MVSLDLWLCPWVWERSVDSFSPFLSVQRSDVGVSIAQRFVDTIEREAHGHEPTLVNQEIYNAQQKMTVRRNFRWIPWQTCLVFRCSHIYNDQYQSMTDQTKEERQGIISITIRSKNRPHSTNQNVTSIPGTVQLQQEFKNEFTLDRPTSY